MACLHCPLGSRGVQHVLYNNIALITNNRKNMIKQGNIVLLVPSSLGKLLTVYLIENLVSYILLKVKRRDANYKHSF